MKKIVEPLGDLTLSLFPIKDVAEGWHFSINEISNGVYRVKGINKWGNSVSRTCSEFELDKTLKLCANDAHEIDNQLKENDL